MSNWHNKTLTERTAICPVSGVAWHVGDVVSMQVPAGNMRAGTITGFRVVSGEIWADIKKEGDFCVCRLTKKLSELECCSH